METKNLGFNTKLIHAGDFEDAYGSAVVPIYRHQLLHLKMPNMGQSFLREKRRVIFIQE